MDKMIDKFREKVEDFVRIYCHEYMSDVSVEYDFSDGNSALIKMEETCGRKWEVPIRETFRNEHGVDIGIDIGDAGYLVDNAGGLYCYLWYETTKKTVAADARNEAAERSIETCRKRIKEQKASLSASQDKCRRLREFVEPMLKDDCFNRQDDGDAANEIRRCGDCWPCRARALLASLDTPPVKQGEPKPCVYLISESYTGDEEQANRLACIHPNRTGGPISNVRYCQTCPDCKPEATPEGGG